MEKDKESALPLPAPTPAEAAATKAATASAEVSTPNSTNIESMAGNKSEQVRERRETACPVLTLPFPACRGEEDEDDLVAPKPRPAC